MRWTSKTAKRVHMKMNLRPNDAELIILNHVQNLDQNLRLEVDTGPGLVHHIGLAANTGLRLEVRTDLLRLEADTALRIEDRSTLRLQADTDLEVRVTFRLHEDTGLELRTTLRLEADTSLEVRR
eukprot:541647_1